MNRFDFRLAPLYLREGKTKRHKMGTIKCLVECQEFVLVQISGRGHRAFPISVAEWDALPDKRKTDI